MKKKNTLNVLCNVISAVLMLALLLCQLLPFWDFGSQQLSIQQYIGFPEKHQEVTSYFRSQISPDFMVKDIVLMPVITLLVGLIGAFFCVWKCKKNWVFLFPMICGISGVIGYLGVPAFQLGAMWQLHLVISILMLVCAIVPMIQCFVKVKDWFLSKE